MRIRQDGKHIVKRLIHLSLIAALAAVALPASASADGGVLLSGYAPPGAGEEAILGAGPAGGTAHGAARTTAPAPGAMALAQPVASAPTRTAAPASVATRGRPATSTAARAARHARTQARGHRIPATSTASPAIVAAATGDAPGSEFGLWQGLLVAALAATTFVLGRTWLRRDK
jgi:hypothetical protein